ncbi:hypothetical protein BDV12DRAFT_204109 [Aspergillus spectabilis]
MASISSLVYIFAVLLFSLESSARYLQASQTLEDCITNSTYTVAKGDNCAKIAKAHSVPRGALISLNGIRPECANLRVGDVLCLPEPCQLYAVDLGASCTDINETNNIRISDLFEWNAYLDPECTNLIAGDQVCVAKPGVLPATSPTPTPPVSPTVVKTTSYATATIPPPGPVPHGTTRKCGQYYQVKSGDYCDSIADRYSIDLLLFQQINPAINTDCSNLVRDYITASLQLGTTPQCYEWYVVHTGDTYSRIGSIYGISLQDLRIWNPSLKEDCSNLRPDVAYCIHGELPTAAVPSADWVAVRQTGPAFRDDGAIVLG